MAFRRNNKIYSVLLLSFLLSASAGAGDLAERPYDCVVAADDTGDFTTVQRAVDSAPERSAKPWRIFIKNGIYKEHVCVPETKPFIHLIGASADSVTITDDRLCGGDRQHFKTQYGATVVIKGNDAYIKGITIDNSWGVEKKTGPQALALYTSGDRIVLYKCRLRSYQDTYLTTMVAGNRAYLRDCLIEGGVDFIYGQGDVVFDHCTLNIVRKKGGWITAPCHDIGTVWGYVFLDCVITAPDNPSETSVWFGRPWHKRPVTVFINTRAEVTIPAEGWFEHMGGLPKLWADYNTKNADGSKQNLDKRRDTYYREENGEKIYCKAQNNLSDIEAAQYTVENILAGHDNWNAQWFLFSDK